MMKFIIKNWRRLVILFYFIAMPAVSFAVGTIDNPLGPNGAKSIQEFIKIFLTGALRIGIPVVALAIIYCGFLFVEARGKPEKLSKAKDALLYTLIGAAILLGSLAIAQMISTTVLAL